MLYAKITVDNSGEYNFSDYVVSNLKYSENEIAIVSVDRDWIVFDESNEKYNLANEILNQIPYSNLNEGEFKEDIKDNYSFSKETIDKLWELALDPYFDREDFPSKIYAILNILYPQLNFRMVVEAGYSQGDYACVIYSEDEMSRGAAEEDCQMLLGMYTVFHISTYDIPEDIDIEDVKDLGGYIDRKYLIDSYMNYCTDDYWWKLKGKSNKEIYDELNGGYDVSEQNIYVEK